jgi:hypothetical protein
MKLFYIKFNVSDWLTDPRLSLCSPLARGVWMDLLCNMHQLDRTGELRGTTDELARLARCSTQELVVALTDIQNKLAGDVQQRNGSWTIANRRMKREADIREKRQQAGSIGGSKSGANREANPHQTCNYNSNSNCGCLEKVREFGRGEGIRDSDSEWFYFKCEGNGWTNGGEPIRDWKATITSWKRAGYLPSQKQNGNGHDGSKPDRQMSAFEIEKRTKAIAEEINTVFKRNGSKRVEGDGIDELKNRRNELQRQLVT